MLSWLEPLADFDCHLAWEASKASYVAPIGCCAVYLMGVVLGPRLMRHRPPWRGRHALALWNFLLSAVSTVGFLVSAPFVLRGLRTHGFHWMICSDEMMFGGHDPTSGAACYGLMGVVMTGFMVLKFPEMLDTLFLVLRKKDVIFLHWWHHFTVVLTSWYAYAAGTPSSVIFATVNYGIHSVMYLYFGVCVYTRALSPFRQTITSLQLLQMAVGLTIVGLTGWYRARGTCSETYGLGYYVSHGGMYGSFLFLFLRFYVEQYQRRPTRRKAE